jgi:hypothetical protein
VIIRDLLIRVNLWEIFSCFPSVGDSKGSLPPVFNDTTTQRRNVTTTPCFAPCRSLRLFVSTSLRRFFLLSLPLGLLTTQRRNDTTILMLSELIKNKSLFWDTDPKSLDPEKHSSYIIPRVMDYGSLEDVRLISNYYGDETIKRVLLEASYLQDKTISFFVWKFGLKREDFRSWRRKRGWHSWR